MARMSAAKAGQRLLNTNSDAYGTTFGPINAAYWKVCVRVCLLPASWLARRASLSLSLCLSLSLSPSVPLGQPERSRSDTRNDRVAEQWNFFYVFLGAFFWQYLTPPVAQCAEFRWPWMALIVARNVSFLWIWVGALHQLLYVWHVVPDKLKFNPSYPKKQQHYRDFLMSTSGALIDSAMQIGFMHLYATRKVAWYDDFWAGPQWAQELGSWQGPAFSVAMILVGCLYQDFHFYWVHRYIHRWGWVRCYSPRPVDATAPQRHGT